MKDPFRWSFEVVVGDNVTSVGNCGNQNLRNFCEKKTHKDFVMSKVMEKEVL